MCPHKWHWSWIHFYNASSQLTFPSLVFTNSRLWPAAHLRHEKSAYFVCSRYSFCGMPNFSFSIIFFLILGCSQLTSSGLSNLIQLRQLEELELTNCPGSSKELIGYLRDNLQKCLVVEWTCQRDKQRVYRCIAWMILQCYYRYQS